MCIILMYFWVSIQTRNRHFRCTAMGCGEWAMMCTIITRRRSRRWWITEHRSFRTMLQRAITLRILPRNGWWVISAVWDIITNSVICWSLHSVVTVVLRLVRETVGQISRRWLSAGRFRRNHSSNAWPEAGWIGVRFAVVMENPDRHLQVLTSLTDWWTLWTRAFSGRRV